MKFDLVDLAVFTAAVETGSLTRGAEQCNLALAAVSSRIRQLESRLQVSLLERGPRGVVATPAGLSLLQHARRILHDVAEMEGDIAEYAGGLKGRVKLLSNTNALTEFLPPALGSFLAVHPDISVSVEERLSHNIIHAVAAGEAAIGIVAGTTDMAGLEHYPFARDRLSLVVPIDWRSVGDSIDFRDVVDQPFIGLHQSSAIQSFLSSQAALFGRSLQLRMQLSGFEQVCKMVESRAGIAVVPESTGERAARTMAIRVIRLLDVWAARDLEICITQKHKLTPVALLLFEHLRDHSNTTHAAA